ncbi:hypothetical protein AB0J14_38385 [Micromonospora arborensis]|uniref:hypothetical protein n=1 Tax=Micromonospora arborensis TaxID=2116518 RepID=UPI0034036EB5
MAELWYPNPSVTQLQHEHLMGGAVASGVAGNPGDPPVVYAPGSGTRAVRVRASRRAVVEGYGWENDASEIALTLGANASGSVRVDLVVLRLDRSDWSVKVKVVAGTPGAGAPSVTRTVGSSGVWELPLAEVTVAAGATTIEPAQVANRAYYITASGYTGTEAWGFPPAEPGVIFRAEDTGVTYIGTSSGTWVTVNEDTGWVSAELGNSPSWSVQGSGVARVRRRNHVVFLHLDLFRVGGPLNGAADWVAAVPHGFQPDREIIMTGALNVGGHAVRFSVRPDRGVWIDAYPTALVPGRAVSVCSSWPI